jgi:hypothetical protein
MSRRNRLIRQLEARWIACYGEPPPIRTDPELMLAVLDDLAAQELDVRREPGLASPAGVAVA